MSERGWNAMPHDGDVEPVMRLLALDRRPNPDAVGIEIPQVLERSDEPVAQE